MSATRTPPRFFVPDSAIVGERAVLAGDERHHLRVRRVRAGAQVELFDNRGRVFDAVVESLSPDRVELRVTERRSRVCESPLDLTLAIALLKKADKLDLVIEKATELGVRRIVLFTCARTLGGCSAARIERWRRIAVSAAKQCGRSVVPAIEGPESLAALATRRAELRLVCWEAVASSEVRPLADTPPLAAIASSVLIIVGPEGGFAEAEIRALRDTGVQALSLGPRILRGETAAIVAVALAQARWGDGALVRMMRRAMLA